MNLYNFQITFIKFHILPGQGGLSYSVHLTHIAILFGHVVCYVVVAW